MILKIVCVCVCDGGIYLYFYYCWGFVLFWRFFVTNL